MATRMQQRRGTAAQWTSANPILNAGEMGWESDTNKFKIGDGTNHWADLDYFIDQSSTVNPAFGSSIVFEGSTSDAYETTLQVTDPTADRTLTLPDETGTLATTTYVDNALAQTNTHAAVQAATTANLSATYAAGSADSSNGTGVGATLTMSSNGAFSVDGYSASSGDRILVKDQTTSIQNGIYTVTTVGSAGTAAVLTRATDYNNTPGGEIKKGDYTFALNGTVNQNIGFLMNASGTNADGSTRIGTDSITFTQVTGVGEIDAGFGITKTGNTLSVDTTMIQARVADISDTEIAYLNGVTSGIQTQIDAKAPTASPTFSGNVSLPSTTSIGDVSNVEIGYLNGVTSAIQTQLGNKADLSGPTFSGAVTLPGTTSIGDVSATEIGYLNGVTGALQTQIDAKAPLAAPVFTGTVSLPSTTTIGDVSNTEISYLDGVTSAIQTQLDGKTATGHTHTASNVTDFTEAAQDAVGNSLGSGLSYNDSTGAISVDTATIQARVADVSDTEIGYLNGVTSAIQTQLDGKSANGHSHAASDVTDFTEAAQDAVGNSVGSGLSYNDSTGAISVDTTIIQAVVSGVSNTEIGYLDGVTSAIQTQIDSKLALAGGTMTGAIAMGTNKITGLGTPTADADAATKAYVDAATAGLNVHGAVQAATTANITLATDVENGDTLDGVTLATGNRILVKNQTTKSQNGVYTVNASGAPTRATDYDSTPEVDAGDFIFVEGGTVNGKTGWVQTNVITTIGTDAIEFTQFSGSGTYTAGTGLTLTGSAFAIDSTVATLTGSQTLTNKTIALGSNTVSGTTAQFNSALTDGDFATLAGSETLTNKTLTSPTMTSPTVSSGALTVSATGITFTDGTQTKEGVPSRTTIVQQSASYNLSTGGLTLRDNLLELNSASAITLTIPANSTTAYPVGTSIDILQTGAGQVTVAGAAGVTVNATPGLKLRAQWSSATLFKRATDTWIVMGDLSA